MSAIPTFMDKLNKRVAFREQLKDGKLGVPSELGEFSQIELSMWGALWHAYLNNEGSISTPYWFDKFANPSAFNQFVKRLSDSGWLHSLVVPGRHWAELSLNETALLNVVDNDKSILLAIRRDNKFAKYRMTCDTKLHSGSRTRQNGVIRDTGLTRNGFALSGTHTFQYDTTILHKYYDAILANTTKSMTKIAEIHTLIEDGADYMSISRDILDYHMYSPDEHFTLGANYNDSRARAISSSLSKVFNPIGFKDARALLIMPGVEVPHAKRLQTTKAVYLFIAELSGIKSARNERHKAQLGRALYKSRTLPTLDLSSESDRKDLHELIWLERLYSELDRFFTRDTSRSFYWTVPVELDAGASMLQIQGALLNDRNLLSITNCIDGPITDPWAITGLTREQVKFACTPMLYGSSAGARELWTKNKVDFDSRHVGLINYEIRSGRYALANDFKDLIISNVQPTEHMDIHIRNDRFSVECNRFRRVGDYTKRYPIWDTDTNTMQAIAHTHTSTVADLKRFSLYFQTLLVHNLDSGVADHIASIISWILTIHDAFIVSPVHALQTRRLYASELESINTNRESIVNNYFRSINIKRNAIRDWNSLMNDVGPVENFKCSDTALK